MADRLEICLKYIMLGAPVYKVLTFAGVPSSTWYDYCKACKEDKRKYNKGRSIPGYSYDKSGNKITDEEIVTYIRSLKKDPHFFNGGGYRKIKWYLFRNYQIKVNHKKLYRLLKEQNLLLTTRKKKRAKRKICVNRVVFRPNQLWEFDIKYGYIHGEEKFFFILCYLDVFSRKVIDYYIGLQCKGHNLAATLQFALIKEGITDAEELVIRSDNGTQMRGNVFKNYLENLKIKLLHEFIPIATPNKNAHVESFFSILEIECLEVNYFNSIEEVYDKVGKFIDFYNNIRIHSSLGYRAPVEVVTAYKEQKDLGKVIKTSV